MIQHQLGFIYLSRFNNINIRALVLNYIHKNYPEVEK